ncbi:MAG TPA: DUF5701 family protein [Vitreimonas sp.]|nr:DUF5701 family protein [Vitreimonas sp.]
MTLHEAFDHQLATLIDKKYHQAAGLTEQAFSDLITPLKAKLSQNEEFVIDIELGKLSFVIVIKSELVPTETAMSVIEKDGKAGVTKLFPHQPTDFSTLETVPVPVENAYLLMNIDRGKENINLPPNQALKIITTAGRTPLTIDEGVAIVTHYPDFLKKNNCFSLLASRHKGDQRVPAIWINGHKEPNLGWCWDGNPHTWLGSASAECRVCA